MAYETCPECGAQKHTLNKCPECGYARRSQIVDNFEFKPRNDRWQAAGNRRSSLLSTPVVHSTAYETCPECGGKKHQLNCCPDCGFRRWTPENIKPLLEREENRGYYEGRSYDNRNGDYHDRRPNRDDGYRSDHYQERQRSDHHGGNREQDQQNFNSGYTTSYNSHHDEHPQYSDAPTASQSHSQEEWVSPFMARDDEKRPTQAGRIYNETTGEYDAVCDGSNGEIEIHVARGKRASEVHFCADCKVPTKDSWRYSESNYGIIHLCRRCKERVFKRTFGDSEPSAIPAEPTD
jgi:ribosomal protein L32